MDISIILINYKSPDLALQCIRSVYQETLNCTFEIIIIDNHSLDDSKQKITSQFNSVIWIDMGYNAGFSRANNAGIKNAKGEYLLLLNSDTIILDNAIDKLFVFMQENKTVAAGCPSLLNADRSPQNAGNYFVKGGLNILLTLPVLNTITKSIGNILKFKKPSMTQATSVHYVDWISGAFMFVRKSVIEKSGMMDEDFFLFSEEIEWCSRLKKQGEIAVYADAYVIHLEGGTTKRVMDGDSKSYYEFWTVKGYQLMISHWLRIRKQYSAGWFLVNVFIFLVEIPILFAVSLFMEKYTFKQALEYCKNVVSAMKFIPKILANKPYFYKVM